MIKVLTIYYASTMSETTLTSQINERLRQEKIDAKDVINIQLVIEPAIIRHTECYVYYRTNE